MGITDCLQNNTTHGSSILMYSRSVGFSVLEWRSRGCRFNPRTAALLETQVAYSGALNYFYDIPYKSCARKPAIATRGQRSSVGIPISRSMNLRLPGKDSNIFIILNLILWFCISFYLHGANMPSYDACMSTPGKHGLSSRQGRTQMFRNGT